jgi:hypothetical protein
MLANETHEASPSGRRLLLIACALVLVLAVDHGTLLPVPLFPLDDAYIAAHNAAALRSGHDPNFPGVSALSGSTSLVHLLLVSAAQTILPLAWASWSIAWLGILLLVTGVCRLIRLARVPWYLGALLLWLSLLAADAGYQVLNGIETGLAMAAIAWAFALRLERVERSPWLLPSLIGLLPLVRPELGLLSALLWFERGLSVAPERRVRRLALDAALALALLVPGVLAYLLATGSPMPQTLSIKRAFFAPACAGPGFGLRWFTQRLAEFVARLNVTAFGLLLLCIPPVQWVAVGFAVGFLLACLIAFPEGTAHNQYRYLYPLLPLCVIGFVHAWTSASGQLRHAVTGLAVVAVIGAAFGVPRSIMLYLADLNLTESELQPVAEFVRQRVPAAEPVLVHDIGYISTVVPNPLVDVVGLKNPRATALHRMLTAKRCEADSRSAVVARLAMERNARYFVVFADWDETFGLTTGLQHLGWTLTPLREREVIYQVYRLTAPERVR